MDAGAWEEERDPISTMTSSASSIPLATQRSDDGLIRKGHTWGGLGWIYSAGTSGLAAWCTAGRAPETG